jgi:hypothetical protein
MKKHVALCITAWTVLALFIAPVWAVAADEEGCAICHKYSGLARLDKTGKVRLFYVNNDMYKNSVHGKVLCRNCHLNLDIIPHTDAKPVDCATKCHLKEPSTNVDFSHGNLITELNNSIHSKTTADGSTKEFSDDMPGCTDCHLNSIYRPVQGLNQEGGISQNALRRCIGCHTEEEWANRYYQHFSHRLHSSRTPVDTVNLCLNCHKDEQLMERHNLPSTENYRDTYHWKGVLYGDRNMPDCIGCHAPVGYSIHSLASMQNSKSPVYMTNLRRTCASTESSQECHPGATEPFATGKVHQEGLAFDQTVVAVVKGETTFKQITDLNAERRLREMKDTDADADAVISMSERERFERMVYILVKWVYTALITVVIGGMLIHQLMDLYRTVQNRKKH